MSLSVNGHCRCALPLLLYALVGASLGLCASCRSNSSVAERTKPPAQAVSASTERTPRSQLRKDQTERASLNGDTLFERNESAYGTSLFILDNEVVLLTQTAVITLADGEPPKTRSLPLGAGAVLVGDSILYYNDGSVYVVPRIRGESQVYSDLKRPPMRLFASKERWGWLDRSTDGYFTLVVSRGKVARPLYRTHHAIAFAAAWDESVFFVEAVARGSWRIGRFPFDGGPAAFSNARQGRTASMLAPSSEGVYFYDGPTRTVRRLSPDLQDDRVLAEKVICSPIAVSDRVFCARVGGIYEIPTKGGLPHPLAVETTGPITAIAADERRVVWLVDTAKDRLAVRSQTLTAR